MIRNAERVLTYPISLLLSTDMKKTCESLGKTIEKSGDSMLRLLHQPIVSMDGLVEIAKKMFVKKNIFLIIDDTLIEKCFSKVIEGTSDNYDSSNKTIYRSLCSIVAMLTDGTIAIPITQSLWTSREFSEDTYKKKYELAQELIVQICEQIDISMVIADGLYATKNMLQWLMDKRIFFEMRFHSNRVIECSETKQAIRDLSILKLRKSRFRRTIAASWKGMILYFTAIKRWSPKMGYHVIYQVSNKKASARDHEKFYSFRWNIEMFFRTAKQYLGLKDCQARLKIAQINHIMNVCFAYTILQYERITHKCSSPEDALRRIKSKTYDLLTTRWQPLGQIFGGNYA
jgi:hypothetical protein